MLKVQDALIQRPDLLDSFSTGTPNPESSSSQAIEAVCRCHLLQELVDGQIMGQLSVNRKAPLLLTFAGSAIIRSVSDGNIYFAIGARLGCVYGCGDGLDMET